MGSRAQDEPTPRAEVAPLAIQELLDRWIDEGDLSAAVALRGSADAIEWIACAGESQKGRAVRTTDRFDLASVTKPFVATLAIALDRGALFPLDAPVGELYPSAPQGLATKAWRDLLAHRAGFIPWWPLYRKFRNPERILGCLLSEEAIGAPSGTYSDLGYIAYALAIEAALGRPLADLLKISVFNPLETSRTGGPGGARGIVQCHLDNSVEVALARDLGIRIARRPGPPLGIPQDGNTRFLGGVCGHAGLFGSAEDMWLLGREWLQPGAVIDRSAVDSVIADGTELAFGWRRRRRSGSGGLSLSRSSFGHPGFTGTSLWIDPDARSIHVLLAHRTSAGVDMDVRRRAFHRVTAQI